MTIHDDSCVASPAHSKPVPPSHHRIVTVHQVQTVKQGFFKESERSAESVIYRRSVGRSLQRYVL